MTRPKLPNSGNTMMIAAPLFRCFQIALAIGAFCLAQSAPNAFAGSLDDAITNLASNISSYLDEKGQRQVMLKDFDGPGAATAGRSIRASLDEVLKTKNVEIVKLGANWTIRGSFSLDSSGVASIVTIRAQLFDKSGKEIAEFREKVQSQEVSSIEDISRLLGTTVDVTEEQKSVAEIKPGAADVNDKIIAANQTLTSKITESVTQPSFAFRDPGNTVVAPSSDSKFRLELLVCADGATTFNPIQIENSGGLPFAPVIAKDIYKVRIHNDADHAVGVKLSIDGINSFALADDPSLKDLGTWYIPAKSSGIIPGWFINGNLAKEFVVTANSESLGLPNAADIGTVTAQFFHAWLENEPVPAIELLAKSRGQLRTGVGRNIERQGSFQKSFFGQQLLSAISVRYSNPDDLPVE